MSPPEKPRYWFPAKRYGWGWGVPCCWQGWLVIIAYVGLLLAGVFWLLHGGREEAPNRLSGFHVWMGAITVAFLLICWLKGEPPKWRWGDKR